MLAALVLSWPMISQARTYDMPINNGNMVGKLQTIKLDASTTLTRLAVEQQVGFDALFAANKQFITDAVPAQRTIKLPLNYILPDTRHVGIVINLPELRLYYFHPDNQRVSIYPIGIGRSGWDTPLMNTEVSGIRKNPSWTPPASIRAHYLEDGVVLPTSIPPGPDNPLGKYALRLGATNILLHGTPNPTGVGRRVSSGCIRLYEADIAELAQLVAPGTPVQIINQPIKWARVSSSDYIEAHQPLANVVNMNNVSTESASNVERRKFALHRGFRTAALLAGDEARQSAERFAHDLQKKGMLFTGLPQRITVKAHLEK